MAEYYADKSIGQDELDKVQAEEEMSNTISSIDREKEREKQQKAANSNPYTEVRKAKEKLELQEEEQRALLGERLRNQKQNNWLYYQHANLYNDVTTQIAADRDYASSYNKTGEMYNLTPQQKSALASKGAFDNIKNDGVLNEMKREQQWKDNLLKNTLNYNKQNDLIDSNYQSMLNQIGIRGDFARRRLDETLKDIEFFNSVGVEEDRLFAQGLQNLYDIGVADINQATNPYVTNKAQAFIQPLIATFDEIISGAANIATLGHAGEVNAIRAVSDFFGLTHEGADYRDPYSNPYIVGWKTYLANPDRLTNMAINALGSTAGMLIQNLGVGKVLSMAGKASIVANLNKTSSLFDDAIKNAQATGNKVALKVATAGKALTNQLALKGSEYLIGGAATYPFRTMGRAVGIATDRAEMAGREYSADELKWSDVGYGGLSALMDTASIPAAFLGGKIVNRLVSQAAAKPGVASIGKAALLGTPLQIGQLAVTEGMTEVISTLAETAGTYGVDIPDLVQAYFDDDPKNNWIREAIRTSFISGIAGGMPLGIAGNVAQGIQTEKQNRQYANLIKQGNNPTAREYQANQNIESFGKTIDAMNIDDSVKKSAKDVHRSFTNLNKEFKNATDSMEKFINDPNSKDKDGNPLSQEAKDAWGKTVEYSKVNAVRKEKAVNATVSAIAKNNNAEQANTKLAKMGEIIKDKLDKDAVDKDGKPILDKDGKPVKQDKIFNSEVNADDLMVEFEKAGLIDEKTRKDIVEELDKDPNYKVEEEANTETETAQETQENTETGETTTKAEFSSSKARNAINRAKDKASKFNKTGLSSKTKEGESTEKKAEPKKVDNNKKKLTNEEKAKLKDIIERANKVNEKVLNDSNATKAEKEAAAKKFWANALNTITDGDLTRADAKEAFAKMISQSNKGLPKNYTIKGLKAYLKETLFFDKMSDDDVKFIKQFIDMLAISSSLSKSSLKDFQSVVGEIDNITAGINELSEKIAKEPDYDTEAEQKDLSNRIQKLEKKFNDMAIELDKMDKQSEELTDSPEVLEEHQRLVNEYRQWLNYLAHRIYQTTNSVKALMGATKVIMGNKEDNQKRILSMDNKFFGKFFKRLVKDFSNVLNRFINNIASIVNSADRLIAIENINKTMSKISEAAIGLNTAIEQYMLSEILPNYEVGPKHENSGIELNRSVYTYLSIYNSFLEKYGDTNFENFRSSLKEFIKADIQQYTDIKNRTDVDAVKKQTSLDRINANLSILFGHKNYTKAISEENVNIDSLLDENEGQLKDLHDIIKLYTIAFFQAFPTSQSRAKGVNIEGFNAYDITLLEERVFSNFADMTGLDTNQFGPYTKTALFSIALNYLQHKNPEATTTFDDRRTKAFSASLFAIKLSGRIMESPDKTSDGITKILNNNNITKIQGKTIKTSDGKSKTFGGNESQFNGIIKIFDKNKKFDSELDRRIQIMRDIDRLIQDKNNKNSEFRQVKTFVLIPNDVANDYSAIADMADMQKKLKKDGKNREKASIRTLPKKYKNTNNLSEKQKRDNTKFEISNLDAELTNNQLELDKLFDTTKDDMISVEEYNALIGAIEQFGMNFADLSSVLYYVPVYEFTQKNNKSTEIVKVLKGYKPLNFDSLGENRDFVINMLNLSPNIMYQDLAEFSANTKWISGLKSATTKKMADIGEMIAAINQRDKFTNGFYFNHENMANGRLMQSNTIFNMQRNKYMRHLVVVKEQWNGVKYDTITRLEKIKEDSLEYKAIRNSLIISELGGYEKGIVVDKNTKSWKYEYNKERIDNAINDIINSSKDEEAKKRAEAYLENLKNNVTNNNDLTADDHYIYQNIVRLQQAIENGDLNWRDFRIEVDGKSTGIFEATMHLNSNSQSLQEALRIHKYVIVGSEVYSTHLSKLNLAKENMNTIEGVIDALRLDQPYGYSVARLYDGLKDIQGVNNLKLAILRKFFESSQEDFNGKKLFKKLRDLGKKFVIAPNYGQGIEQISASRKPDSLHAFLFEELAKEVNNEFREIISEDSSVTYKQLVEQFIARNLDKSDTSLGIVAGILQTALTSKNTRGYNALVKSMLDLDNEQNNNSIQSNPFFDVLHDYIYENSIQENVFEAFANTLDSKVFSNLNQTQQNKMIRWIKQNQFSFNNAFNNVKNLIEQTFIPDSTAYNIAIQNGLNPSVLNQNYISQLLNGDVIVDIARQKALNKGITLSERQKNNIKAMINYFSALNDNNKIESIFDLNAGLINKSLEAISDTSKVRKIAGDYKRLIMQEAIKKLIDKIVYNYHNGDYSSIDALDEVCLAIADYLNNDLVMEYGDNRKFVIGLSKSESNVVTKQSTTNFINAQIEHKIKPQISAFMKQMGANKEMGISEVKGITNNAIASLVVTLLEHPIESSVGNRTFVNPEFPVHSAIYDGYDYSIALLSEGAESWNELFMEEKAINPMFNLLNVMILTKRGSEEFIDNYIANRDGKSVEELKFKTKLGEGKAALDNFLAVGQYVDFASLVRPNNIAVEEVVAIDEHSKEMDNGVTFFVRNSNQVETSPAYDMFIKYMKEVYIGITDTQRDALKSMLPIHIYNKIADSISQSTLNEQETQNLNSYLDGSEYLSEKVIFVKDDKKHPSMVELSSEGSTDKVKNKAIIHKYNTNNIFIENGNAKFNEYPLDKSTRNLFLSGKELTDTDIINAITSLRNFISNGKDLYLKDGILSKELRDELQAISFKDKNGKEINNRLLDFYRLFNAALYSKPNFDGVISSMSDIQITPNVEIQETQTEAKVNHKTNAVALNIPSKSQQTRTITQQQAIPARQQVNNNKPKQQPRPFPSNQVVNSSNNNTADIWFGNNSLPMLSNMAERPFQFTFYINKNNELEKKTITFKYVEQAYQVLKSGYFNENGQFVVDNFDSQTFNKYISKFYKQGTKIRGQYAANNKHNIRLMHALVYASFLRNEQARQYLRNNNYFENTTLTHKNDNGIWKTAFADIMNKVKMEIKEADNKSAVVDSVNVDIANKNLNAKVPSQQEEINYAHTKAELNEEYGEFDANYKLSDHIEAIEQNSFQLGTTEAKNNVRNFVNNQDNVPSEVKAMQHELFDALFETLPEGTKILVVKDEFMPNNTNGLFDIVNGVPYVLVKESAYADNSAATLAHELTHAGTELAMRMQGSIGARNLVSKIQRLQNAAVELLQQLDTETLQELGLVDENGNYTNVFQSISKDTSEFIAYFASDGNKLSILNELSDRDITEMKRGIPATKLGKLVNMIKQLLKAVTNIITMNRMFYEKNNTAAQNLMTYISKLGEYNDPTRAAKLDKTTYNRISDISNKFVRDLWAKVPYLNSLMQVDTWTQIQGYTQADIERIVEEIREEYNNSPVFTGEYGKPMRIVQLFKALRPMYYKTPLHREVALTILNETLTAHSNIITDEIRALLRDFRVITPENMGAVENMIGRVNTLQSWKSQANNALKQELDKFLENSMSDEVKEKIKKLEEEFVMPSQKEMDDDLTGTNHLSPKEKIKAAEGIILNSGLLYMPDSEFTAKERANILRNNLELMLFDDGTKTKRQIEEFRDKLRIDLFNLLQGSKEFKKHFKSANDISNEVILYFMQNTYTLGGQRFMGSFDKKGLQNISHIIDNLQFVENQFADSNNKVSMKQLHTILDEIWSNRYYKDNKQSAKNYQNIKNFLADMHNLTTLQAIRHQKEVNEKDEIMNQITAQKNEALLDFFKDTLELEQGKLSEGFVELMEKYSSLYTALSNAAKSKTRIDMKMLEQLIDLENQYDAAVKVNDKARMSELERQIKSHREAMEGTAQEFGGLDFKNDTSFDNFTSYQFNKNISQVNLGCIELQVIDMEQEDIENYYRGITNNPNITSFDEALQYFVGLGFRPVDEYGKSYDMESNDKKWRFNSVSDIIAWVKGKSEEPRARNIMLVYEGIDANNNDINQTFSFMGRTTDVKGEKVIMGKDNTAYDDMIESINSVFKVGEAKANAATRKQLSYGFMTHTPIRGSKTAMRAMPNRLQFENSTKVDTSIQSRLLRLNEMVYQRQEEEKINIDFVKAVVKDTLALEKNPNKEDMKKGFIKIFDLDYKDDTIDIEMDKVEHRLPENISKMLRAAVNVHNKAYPNAPLRQLYINKDIAQLMLGMQKQTVANFFGSKTKNPAVRKWLNKIGYRLHDVLQDIKSTVVIRNPEVLAQNVISNQLSLLATGMSMEQIALASEAIESDIKQFQKDMLTLYGLRTELDAIKSSVRTPQDRKEEADKLKQEIDIVETRLKNNRVYYPMMNGVDSNIEDKTKADTSWTTGMYRKGVDFVFDKAGISKALSKWGIDIEYAKNIATYSTESELFKHSVLFNRTGDIVPKIIAYEKYKEEGMSDSVALRKAKTLLIDYNMPVESKLLGMMEGLGAAVFIRFMVRVLPALAQNISDKPINTLQTMALTSFLHSISPFGIIPVSIFNEADGAVDKLTSPYRTILNGENMIRWGWLF